MPCSRNLFNKCEKELLAQLLLLVTVIVGAFLFASSYLILHIVAAAAATFCFANSSLCACARPCAVLCACVRVVCLVDFLHFC